MNSEIETCELCGEQVDKLYRHHVVPKAEGGKHDEICMCCRTCSKQMHMLFTNKELAKMSLADLKESENMKKYLLWKKKHPGDHGHKNSQKVREWKKYHR